MPPSTKGKGGKNKRKGKNDGEVTKRELLFKDDGQEYAQVSRMLGDGRCDITLFDDQNSSVTGHIRGKMRKKVWISAGDVGLVGLREYQDGKVDIIHKYNADEARNLKAFGELPERAKINETAISMSMGTMDDNEDEVTENISFDFESI